jgi:hypothetical protein
MALFCGFLKVVGGISALSPEIGIFSRKKRDRWKSAEVPELFCSCVKFQIFS